MHVYLTLKCFSSSRRTADTALTMISLWRLTSMPNFMDCMTVILKLEEMYLYGFRDKKKSQSYQLTAFLLAKRQS